jgi:hypothetical protein
VNHLVQRFGGPEGISPVEVVRRCQTISYRISLRNLITDLVVLCSSTRHETHCVGFSR